MQEEQWEGEGGDEPLLNTLTKYIAMVMTAIIAVAEPVEMATRVTWWIRLATTKFKLVLAQFKKEGAQFKEKEKFTKNWEKVNVRTLWFPACPSAPC